MEIAKDFDAVRKIKKELQMDYWNNLDIVSFGIGGDAIAGNFTIIVGFRDLRSFQKSKLPNSYKGVPVVKEVVGEFRPL